MQKSFFENESNPTEHHHSSCVHYGYFTVVTVCDNRNEEITLLQDHAFFSDPFFPCFEREEREKKDEGKQQGTNYLSSFEQMCETSKNSLALSLCNRCRNYKKSSLHLVTRFSPIFSRCTVVLYNPRKNRQSHITNASRKTVTCLGFSDDGR